MQNLFFASEDVADLFGVMKASAQVFPPRRRTRS
jgi:hypothetical protein